MLNPNSVFSAYCITQKYPRLNDCAMSLIALTCPKCGGNLEFEDSRDFGFCQYCGAKVMIKDEVNNTVNNTVNNYNNTTIITSGSEEQNRRKIAAAQKAVSESKYDIAKNLAEEILAQDSTYADAYLILMECAALSDYTEFGYILKASESAVRSNFEKYHLYSNDNRSMKDILNDVGVSYTQQSVAESYKKRNFYSIRDGVKTINELMGKAVIKVREKELLKDVLGIYLECPALVTCFEEAPFEYAAPNFCDFVYKRNGRNTSFMEEYRELCGIVTAYQGFRKTMGEETALSQATISDYLGKLRKKSNRQTPASRMLFGLKKDSEAGHIDSRRTEAWLNDILRTSGSFDASGILLKNTLDNAFNSLAESTLDTNPAMFFD